ncbi:PEGA domain-containing protein [bacterium]|nr:PEGA domain-containing protein [bacterium]
MLTDKEREELREKVRRELAEKERRRIKSHDETVDHPEEKEPRDQRTHGRLNKYEQAVQPDNSAGTEQKHRYNSEDWLEITRLKEEVEDDFYNSKEDYIQYYDRHGQNKWIHRALFNEKQRKARSRIDAKRSKLGMQRRNILLALSTSLFIFVAAMYISTHRPKAYLEVTSNIEGAVVFIDNEMTHHSTDAFINNISPGKHKIALYKPGYNTKFTSLELLKHDTTQIYMELEEDTKFVRDRKEIEPAKETLFPPAWTSEGKIRPKTQVKPTGTSSAGKTSLLITSNITDAVVAVDGKPTEYEINREINRLSPGSHIIELQKQGYRCDPAYAVVKLTAGENTKYLSFELIKEVPLLLIVNTEPVDADIYVDGILMGHGETVQKYQKGGDMSISFGDVRGYNPPPSIDIQLSERNPTIKETGIYYPIINMSVKINQDSLVEQHGIKKVVTGYHFSNTGFVPSGEAGPGIKKLEYYDIYAWEMGYAFSRRNPPGSDFVQIVFNLPDNFEKNKVLFLNLRGFASNNNYLFNLTKVTDIAVEVNGKEIVSHYSPISNIDRNDPIGRDSWPISDFLKNGENTITVRTTDENKCYYYLHAIEIN